jgi:hypothetical protein
MTKGIYSFYVEYGRMGQIDGVFVADSEDIKNIAGKEVYFGEVLGKHPEVVETMEDDYFTLKSDNQEFVTMFEQLGLDTGFNPFDYI